MAGIDATISQGSHSVFLEPGAGNAIALGDSVKVILKAVGSDSAGMLTAFETALQPRTAGPPLHLHRRQDEAFYVLEGEMSYSVDSQTFTAPVGSFVFVPRGILHTFWNAGDVPAKHLIILTPAGIEDYFQEVTQVLGAGGPEAITTAAALMEKHDMIVPPGVAPAYGALTPS